jgi:hypothetical protein
MTNSITAPYLLLKTAVAPKLGQRSEGGITFLVLADSEHQQLFISITGNAGGGYFSREIVPLAAVERCLPADKTMPITAKSFINSFVGKSSNNPGFMAAILRSEGLLGPHPDKPHQHLMTDNWPTWKAAQLALPGEPYTSEPAGDKAKTLNAAVDPDSATSPAWPFDPVETPKVSRKDRGRKAKGSGGKTDAQAEQPV